MKKKVLILAYDFPPYVSVGGLRPYNWFKYLLEFDVEPVVVTRQWGNTYGNHLDYIAPGWSENVEVEHSDYGTILRSPYRPNLSNRIMLSYGEKRFGFLRKLITAYYEIMQFALPIGPKSEVYKAARAYLNENKVDVIIATGDPFVLFSYASKLSKEFGTPWIADYRDPWSHNQEYGKNVFWSSWNRLLEKKIVPSAAHITTVSSFMQRKINTIVRNKPFTILPNGYDPNLIEAVASIPQDTDELNIGFVGTIYEWHPIESFLRVSAQFIQDQPNARFRLNFYGTNIQDKLALMVEERFPALKDHVSITPRIPNGEVLEKLAKNNVLLLFNYYSYMGTKIYDYLGLRRKIILCYSDDPEANTLKEKYYRIEELDSESKNLQADLIKETNAGIVVKDAVQLREVLTDLWKEFSTSGHISCHSIGEEKYSRKVQVERMAELLRSLRP